MVRVLTNLACYMLHAFNIKIICRQACLLQVGFLLLFVAHADKPQQFHDMRIND